MSDNNEAVLLMICGVAGSGKSEFAKSISDDRDDIVYLSSDNLRVELFGDINNQENNSIVFDELAKRANKSLKDNMHVIIDATNTNRRRRMHMLRQFPKDIKKNICYIATEYDDIVYQNNNRDRVVPIDVINRMYKSMHIPVYGEGWDNIEIIYHDNILNTQFPQQFSDAVRAEVLFNRDGYDLIKFLASYFKEFSEVYELPQDSKWHSFSVSRHIYYVYKYILENYESSSQEDMEMMLWTALLHDIGKGFSKSFINHKGEETRYANFIGHEFVGSQMAVGVLYRLGYDTKFIHKVVTLIQFHMYLLNENANVDKLTRYVGSENVEKLKILRIADTESH